MDIVAKQFHRNITFTVSCFYTVLHLTAKKQKSWAFPSPFCIFPPSHQGRKFYPFKKKNFNLGHFSPVTPGSMAGDCVWRQQSRHY